MYEFLQPDGWMGGLNHPAATPVEDAGRQEVDEYDVRTAVGAQRDLWHLLAFQRMWSTPPGRNTLERAAGIMHTADGGESWNSISMAAHANLLIDTYFTDDTHGWVVGGQGGNEETTG